MDGRWGFDEADDDEFDDLSASGAQDTDPELVIGQDASGTVTVSLVSSGGVSSVELTRDWRAAVESHALHNHVSEAMNTATARLLARRAEQVDMSGDEPPGTNGAQEASNRPEEETPITREHAMHLLSTVTADVERFVREASAITGQTVTTESAGAHVSVSGMRGQVGHVSIDTVWVASARTAEIAAELGDALAEFAARFSLGELAEGPQSPAINELMSLVSDPDMTIRRIKRRSSS